MAKLNKQSNQKTLVGFALFAVVILVASSVFVYYEYFEEKETEEIEIVEEPTIDDRISPLANLALSCNIKRIRKNGMEEVIRKVGTSWKKQPSFGYTVTINNIESEMLSFTGWDTGYIGQEPFADVNNDQELVDVKITIYEPVKRLLKTTYEAVYDVEFEYNTKTGRHKGDDSVNDEDGYCHINSEQYEIWFEISQRDYDGDGIPYWTEVNVLKTNPEVDDRVNDPDEDGIPTVWEWKWGYDPSVYDDHLNLDPDVDGLNNLEEYEMRKWLASPFQPEIYIEVDFMEGKSIGPDYVFWEESQQLVMEKFSKRQYPRAKDTSNSITVHIDDGRMGGGGEYFEHHGEYIDQASGIISEYYKYNFDDSRKGIFRYLVMAYDAGWAHPQDYKGWYDTMAVGASPSFLLKHFRGFNVEPRVRRLVQAIQVMHEVGHTCNLSGYCEGIDNASSEAVSHWRNYESCMNYHWMYRPTMVSRILYGKNYGLKFDYSDGRRDEPDCPDCNDWEQLDISFFQTASGMVEGIEPAET